MRKALFLLIASLNLFAVNVLVLNSYRETLPWTEMQNHEIIQNLQKSKIKDINIYTEFMDTKIFRPTDKREKIILKYYQNKYENISFDVVMTTDDNALNFVRKYKNSRLFKDAKVFFSGVNNLSLENLLDKNIYAGIFERKNPFKNLKLAKIVTKRLKTLYLISDNTLTGQKEIEFYKKELSKFKNIKFVYLNDSNFENILKRLDKYDKNSAMMLLTFTSFRMKGKHILSKDALEILSKKYKNPMLIHSSIFINMKDTNIIGGDCTDAIEQAKASSFKAIEYISGKKMKDIGFISNGGNRVYLNVRNLEKFGLSTEEFSKYDPLLVNSPTSFYHIYKIWIWIFLLFVFFTVLFIAVLGRKNIALKKALENFEVLAETSFGAIAVYDEFQKIQYINEQTIYLTQFSKDELIGKNVFDFICPDDMSKVKENMQKEIVDPYDVRIMRKDGTYLYALLRAKTIIVRGEKMRIATVIDITERMLQEQKIQEMNTTLKKKIKKALEENTKQLGMLQQQNKLASMGEMIGSIAHQWRQPLNAINLNIQNLDDDFEDGLIDKKFIEKFISKNLSIIEFMSKTIDDFRNFYRIDKVKVDFDVRDAIDDVLYMQSSHFFKNNIELSIKGNSFVVNGYESEFKQVILNLLSNAEDAMIDGDKKIKKIEIVIRDGKVAIRNNGEKIPNEILNRIFEPYFTTKEQGKGTGMGLYISKMIIENNMNGTLSARNRDGWVEFTVDITNN